MNPNLIILSHATYIGASGATAAATYKFMTKDYKPPEQDRYLDYDVIKNQNGKFKYVYDNGPGFRKWNPFSIVCEDKFNNGLLGYTAAQQYAHLLEMWNYPGVMGIFTPDGAFNAHWSTNALGLQYRRFPKSVSDPIEYKVVIQLEE